MQATGEQTGGGIQRHVLRSCHCNAGPPVSPARAERATPQPFQPP